MKKTLLYSLIASLFLIFLTACGNDSSSTKETKKEETSYTVTDDRGKEITLKKVPETVVSLQPSNTEILFALGAGDKIVGATEYDTYPEEAKKIKRVGDTMTVNAEAVIALNPDAVIAYTNGDDKGIKQLEDTGIPVFVISSAQTFEDVYGNIEQIASVMGVKEKGDELVSGIKKQVANVQEKIASVKEKERVYYEVSPAPDIFTAGSETFQQEILNNAGVENVFADQKGWVKISEEEIVKRNPDTILTPGSEDPVKEFKSRAGWDQINAVKNEKIYSLDTEIMSRPGPRIGEAVELTAKTVYPDLFK
ncbi:ABC transporter substrate-binding protein [Bacillus sp. B190/17]|uniref:ABC transporter substrate-binding protein n=1 Tax=Bacillus lumedeiriae TaxID=3058829 RepID=A0ABW8IEM0_9BACI